MTLDEILTSLFPNGHTVRVEQNLILGAGSFGSQRTAHVIGISDRAPLGVDEAIQLSRHVLDIAQDSNDPILVIVDSDSQRMSKRDELMGLNEYLAHLAKCLVVADLRGVPTVGILYGHSAAGAFIATALATRALVALPGADPEVMDLPSMSKVTKLSIDVLKQKAETTPVFAPGLDNFAKTGAVVATWDETLPLNGQLLALLGTMTDSRDRRDRLGAERNGRPKAAAIAERVRDLAVQAYR